jgi:WD40-like Beta Propeller Repeat
MSTGRRSRRAILTSLVLVAVAVVAVAATVDALRGGGTRSRAAPAPDGSARLVGELLPEDGTLPGRLVFASLAGCRPQEASLDTLVLGAPGESLECGLWVSPRGDLAVVALEPALGLRGSVNGLLRLGDPPELVRRLGVSRGEPSWSADGERLAWCTEQEETVVLTLDTGARTLVPGCHPVFAPDGSVLTRPASLLAATLLVDGRPTLEEEDLLRGFPPGEGPVDLVGYDVRADGLIALVAVRFESGRRPRRLLQLWRGARLESALLLPELSLPAGYGRLGERLEFAPNGREVAVAFPGAGKQMVLVDLADLTIVLGPTSQHGFAWSPEGTWFALSTGEEVRLLGRDREVAYVLPIGAATLAWRDSRML